MTTPLLALLLRRALPELRVLDLAVAEGGLYPWWPAAMLALDDAAPLPEAERALLAGFRVPGVDPALAAGAPEAWGGEGTRLVVAPAAVDPAPWLTAGTLVLARAPEPPAVPRIMLILGLGGAVEQHDLLLPEDAMDTVLPALVEAVQGLAGPGWECGLRPVTPRLAALTLFAPAEALAPLVLSAAALLRQEEAPGRVRVLLGVLPPRPMRLCVTVEGGAPALFLDSAPYADGAPFFPTPGLPTVLGLAGETVLRQVEIVPA